MKMMIGRLDSAARRRRFIDIDNSWITQETKMKKQTKTKTKSKARTSSVNHAARELLWLTIQAQDKTRKDLKTAQGELKSVASDMREQLRDAAKAYREEVRAIKDDCDWTRRDATQDIAQCKKDLARQAAKIVELNKQLGMSAR